MPLTGDPAALPRWAQRRSADLERAVAAGSAATETLGDLCDQRTALLWRFREAMSWRTGDAREAALAELLVAVERHLLPDAHRAAEDARPQ
jgi:hypothetical protein